MYTTTLQLTVTHLVKKFSTFHGSQSLTVFHKKPPSDFMLSQLKPVNGLTFCFFKIHFNIFLPSMPSLPSGLVLVDFLTEIMNAFLISPLHSTCRLIVQIYEVFPSFSSKNREAACFEMSQIRTVRTRINGTYFEVVLA